MAILFKIGNTDLTPWEDKEQHSVNQGEEYASWTDGNWIEHREIARTRIAGSVVLKFKKETDFNTFKSLLTSERNVNGYYPITVWVSNTQTSETINAFLSVSGDTKWDVTCPRVWRGVTVSITQR